MVFNCLRSIKKMMCLCNDEVKYYKSGPGNKLLTTLGVEERSWLRPNNIHYLLGDSRVLGHMSRLPARGRGSTFSFSLPFVEGSGILHSQFVMYASTIPLLGLGLNNVPLI